MAHVRHHRRPTRLRRIPQEFLLCRDRSISHPWDIIADFHFTKDRHGVRRLTRTSRCERCGTVKHEHFDHVGPGGYLAKTSTRYLYPDGYSIVLDHDLGPVRSGEVWAELSTRAKKASREDASAK
jgi:hypothetical protein